jgi:hypothetical protein
LKLLLVGKQIRDSDLSVHHRGKRDVANFAENISVRDVLASLEAEFASTTAAIANGEFALWLGSGVSGQAPSLGGLIERAVEFLRQKAIAFLNAAPFNAALERVLSLARQDPATLRHQFDQPFDTWPQRKAIVDELWNQYSDLLDIRIANEADDYILWDAIDIRAAFAYWAARALEGVVGARSSVFIAVTNLDVELRVATTHKQRALS